MLEMCHCITAAISLMPTLFPHPFVFCLQEMFAFLNKRNLRQYIYKVNPLLVSVDISHRFLYLSSILMPADLIAVQWN